MLSELGRRLASPGAIACADDIYWLELAELQGLVTRLEKGEVLHSFAPQVECRKAKWRAMRSVTPPTTLPKISWLKAFFPSSDGTGHTLKGFAASAGRATARACVMLGPEDFGKMQPGDVIIYSSSPSTHNHSVVYLGDGKIEVQRFAPVKSDAIEQAQIIESLIEKKVNGIAVSVNDADALKESIDKAMNAGIPVVTFDSDAPKSKRLAYYGTANFPSGKLLADHLVKHMGTKGKIGILMGTPGAPNLEERRQGILEYLKNYPEIEIVAECANGFEAVKAVAEKLRKAHHVAVYLERIGN